MAEINDIDLKLNLLADDKASPILKDLSSTLDGLRSTLSTFKDLNPFAQMVTDVDEMGGMLKGLQTDVKALRTSFDGLASSPGLLAVREVLSQIGREVAVTEGDARRNPFATWNLDQLQSGLPSLGTLNRELSTAVASAERLSSVLGRAGAGSGGAGAKVSEASLTKWFAGINQSQLTSAQRAEYARAAANNELMGFYNQYGAELGAPTPGGGSSPKGKNTIPPWMKAINKGGNLISELPMKFLYGGMNSMMAFYGLQAIANGTNSFESIRQIQQSNNMTVNQAAQAYAMMGAAGLTGTAGSSFLSSFGSNMVKMFTPAAGSGAMSQSALLLSSLGFTKQNTAQSPWMMLNTIATRYQALLGQGRGQQAAELLGLSGTTQFAGAFQNWGGLQKQMSGIKLGMSSQQLQNTVNENITLQGQIQQLGLAFDHLAASISPTVIHFVKALTDLANGLSGNNGKQGAPAVIKGVHQAASDLGPGWSSLFATMFGVKAIQWGSKLKGGLTKLFSSGSATEDAIGITEGAADVTAGAFSIPVIAGMSMIPWNKQAVNSIPSRLKQAHDTSLYQYGRFGPNVNNYTSTTGFWSSIHQGFTHLENWASKAGHDLSNWSINAGDHIRNFADISSNDITGWAAQGKTHLFNWATNTETRISDWSSNAKQHIQSFASNTRTSFDNWSTHLQAWASNLWPRVTSDFNSWRTHLSSWAANLWPSVTKEFGTWGKDLSLWASNLWPNVQSDLSSWDSNLSKWSSGLWVSVESDFTSFTSNLSNWASGLWGSVSHWFSNMFGGGSSTPTHVSSTPNSGASAYQTGRFGQSVSSLNGGNSNLSSWVQKAISIAKAPASWAGDLVKLVQHEDASLNPSAVNPTGVNYGGGHGIEHAIGLAQMMPTTFSAYAIPGHTNINNAVDNLASAVNYIRSKYITPANIPGIGTSGPYKGYASGGMISEPIVGIGMNSGTGYTFGEMGPEYIMPMNRRGGRVAGGGQVFNVTINVPGMVGASQVRDLARQVATEFTNSIKRRGNFDMG